MRIVCPSCSATYEVPDSLVTAGRVVRCARCGADWTPLAAVPAMEPEFTTVETVEPPRQRLDSMLNEDAVREDAVRSSPRFSAMDRLAAHQVGPPSRTGCGWPGRRAWCYSGCWSGGRLPGAVR